MARRRNIPPRILRFLQQQQQQQQPQLIPPARILKQRSNLPPRILKLRAEQQQQEEQAAQTILREARCMGRRELCVEYYPKTRCSESDLYLQLQLASMERLVMLQRQVILEQQTVMMEKQFKKQEVQQKIKVEENLTEESTVDYKRLTSFLEKDDSFLTPWNWNPEEKQTMKSRPEPYYSFNVMKPPSKNEFEAILLLV